MTRRVCSQAAATDHRTDRLAASASSAVSMSASLTQPGWPMRMMRPLSAPCPPANTTYLYAVISDRTPGLPASRPQAGGQGGVSGGGVTTLSRPLHAQPPGSGARRRPGHGGGHSAHHLRSAQPGGRRGPIAARRRGVGGPLPRGGAACRCANSSGRQRRRCRPNWRPRRPNRSSKPRWLFHHLTGRYPTF